jgi:mannose-6-phosphate isomerase-like protein (cupin superfamily)
VRRRLAESNGQSKAAEAKMRVNLRAIRWAGLLAAMGVCALANPRLAGPGAAGGGQTNMTQTSCGNIVRYFPAPDVTAALQKGTPLLNDPSLNYRILSGQHTSPGVVEQHTNETDVFYVVDGAATFITGGTMIGGKEASSGEWRGTDIQGGDAHSLVQGDVIVIPAGTPHWFKTVPTAIHYFVVKVKTN